VLLFGSAGLKSKDAGVRASAIELLGQIAARLKQDAIFCNRDTLRGFLELQSPDEDGRLLKEMCAVCGDGKGSKFTVPCESCFRWFHGYCVGVTGHDFIGRGWVCQYCYCRRQLIALETSLKGKAADGKLIYKSKGMIQSRNPDDITVPKTGDVILQQMLLNYLDESSGSDSVAVCAHRLVIFEFTTVGHHRG
jgi:cohesin loading factor subunit SCC2